MANGATATRHRPGTQPVSVDSIMVSDYEQWKNRAERYNRNLLQYGAALASVLAVATGSGSLFALAIAQTKETSKTLEWALWLIGSLEAVLLTAALVLVMRVAHALKRRGDAEQKAEGLLRELIHQHPGLNPDSYLPEHV